MELVLIRHAVSNTYQLVDELPNVEMEFRFAMGMLRLGGAYSEP